MCARKYQGILAFVSALFLSGCTSYRVEGLFTQPVLKTYTQHTIFGLAPEREQILMAAYLNAFPKAGKAFVDGQSLLSNGDVASARMAEESRLRIAQKLGVEAIILAFHEQKLEGEYKIDTLVMRIVDANTGEIAGSVIVRAKSQSGAPVGALARKAVAAVKAHLELKPVDGRGVRPDASRSAIRSRGLGIRDDQF